MAVVFGRREKAKASKKSSSETSKQPAREKPLEEEEGCLDNTYIWLYMYRYNCPFHLLRGFIAWRITPHSPTWCRSSARHQEGQRSFLRSFIWTDTAQVLRCHDELVKMKILRTPRIVTPDVLCIARGFLFCQRFSGVAEMLYIICPDGIDFALRDSWKIDQNKAPIASIDGCVCVCVCHWMTDYPFLSLPQRGWTWLFSWPTRTSLWPALFNQHHHGILDSW